MTEKEKNDKLEDLENLKIFLKFHTENRVLKVYKKFLEHVDAILDEISRIEEELKNDNKNKKWKSHRNTCQRLNCRLNLSNTRI